MRRITIVGSAALCALALAALGAAGAGAAEPTAFTCVAGGSGGKGIKFSDADCTKESATGEFGHLAIPTGTSTELTLKTIAGEATQTIEVEIAGALVQITATGIACTTCMIENAEPHAGEMQVVGVQGTIVYTGVTVPKNPGCEVIGTVTGVTTSGSVETEEIDFASIGTLEMTFSPFTPPVLAEFKIAAKPGQKCTIAGSYQMTGNINAVTNGAILSVNVPLGTTLQLNGKKMRLQGKATMEAGETGVAGTEHHPVALT